MTIVYFLRVSSHLSKELYWPSSRYRRSAEEHNKQEEGLETGHGAATEIE